MKKLGFLCLILALALCLCACENPPAETTEATTEATTEPATVPTEPPITAEDILAASKDGEGSTANELSMTIDMDIHMTTLGMRMNMTAEVAISMRKDPALGQGYAEQTMTTSIYGEKTEERSQTYIFYGEDENVCYSYYPEYDYWSMDTTRERRVTDYILSETAQLRDATEMYAGVECFVLEADLDSKMFVSDINFVAYLTLGQKQEDEESIDTTAVAGHLVAYVEKETMVPRGYEITVEGLDTAANVLLEELVDPDTLGTEVSVTMNAYSYTITGMTYDAVQIPEISEENKALAKQNSFDPDQGDGSYILQESGNAVRVTPPVGWEVASSDYYALFLSFGDSMYGYCFMYQDEADLNENMAYYVDYYESNYALTMTTGSGKDIGGFPTEYYEGGGLYGYGVQIPVGEAYCFILVENFEGMSPFAFLQAIAETLEIVDLTTLD